MFSLCHDMKKVENCSSVESPNPGLFIRDCLIPSVISILHAACKCYWRYVYISNEYVICLYLVIISSIVFLIWFCLPCILWPCWTYSLVLRMFSCIFQAFYVDYHNICNWGQICFFLYFFSCLIALAKTVDEEWKHTIFREQWEV